MFTADKILQMQNNDLDERIENAVLQNRSRNGAYMRVYIEDWFCRSIKQELEKRGFINIDVPDIILKGDVYFEWRNSND